MRNGSVIALLVFWFVITPACFADSSIQEIENCIAAIKQSHGEYFGRIPHQILAADRKLFRMSRAMLFIEENFEKLKHLAQTKPSDSATRLLVANAAEGCKAFHEAFVVRARKFLGLGLCFLAIFGLLTLWVVFNILPFPSGGVPVSPKSFIPRGEVEPSDAPKFSSDTSVSRRDPNSG